MRSRNGVLALFRVGGVGLMIVAGVVFILGVPLGGEASLGALITSGTLGFIGLIWFLVSVTVGGWYKRTADKQAHDRSLFETGRRATGVIERVEQTNTYINSMPVVYVTINVAPKYGKPFTHTEKIVTPASAVPLPGQLIDVAVDPNDPSNVALDTMPGFMGLPGVVLRTRPGDPSALPPDPLDPLDRSTSPPSPSAEAGSPDAQLDRLERLAKLHEKGVLTDAEFAEEKSRLLNER